MTVRRSVPCLSRSRDRLCRLPAMERTIGTMSTVRSASVIPMRRSLCRHVRARCQAPPGRGPSLVSVSSSPRSDALTMQADQGHAKFPGGTWNGLCRCLCPATDEAHPGIIRSVFQEAVRKCPGRSAMDGLARFLSRTTLNNGRGIRANSTRRGSLGAGKPRRSEARPCASVGGRLGIGERGFRDTGRHAKIAHRQERRSLDFPTLASTNRRIIFSVTAFKSNRKNSRLLTNDIPFCSASMFL